MEASTSSKRHAEPANNISDSKKSKIDPASTNPFPSQDIEVEASTSGEIHAGPANNVFNIEDMSYLGGGLKNREHGVLYQLHLLMLILWRAYVLKYFNFRLTSELTEAGKLDDIVFLSKTESNSEWKSRSLQVKHTTATKKVITIKDFFTEKDGEYDVPKYFKSFTKINERSNTKSNYSIFSDSAIEDVILITNIRYDGIDTNLKNCLEEIDIEPDKLLGIPGNTELKVFKLKRKVLQEHRSKFENVSDFKELIKLLVDPEVKQIEKTHKVFMEYYYALMRDVLVFEKDKKNMRFSKKFIDGTYLPKEVDKFRAYLETYIQESKLKLINFKWKITDAKEFKPKENPEIVNPAKFAEQLCNILKYFEKNRKLVKINKNNLAKVFEDSNGTTLSIGGRKTFIANIRKLAGHVLIRKSGIRFSTCFIQLRDNLPGNLGTFRSKLEKLCDFNSIDKHKFEIGFKFQTCEEGSLEKKLPKPFDDDFKILIKFFVDHNEKQIQKTHKVFMKYYYALMRDVFEKDNKIMRFSNKFIEGSHLPQEVDEFRTHFEKYIEGRNELKDFNWKITGGLAKEFQPKENPEIIHPAKFARQFHDILKYFEKLVKINEDNLVKVFHDSNGTSLSGGERETFIANIRNLAGHVLIRKFSEIRFSTSFIRSSDQENEEEMNTLECKKPKKTPDGLETFRLELKKLCDEHKLVDFNSIDQYKFKIGLKEFQTCEEGALKRKLPKPLSDDDFKDLIKLLVDPKVKQIEKTHKVFMEYYYALMRDVFEKDKKNMWFTKKFIDGTNLPKEVHEFRTHYLSSIKGINKQLEDFNWKISDGLAKEFQPEENPKIVDPAKFAQQFHDILKYFEKVEKLVEIDEDDSAKVFQDSNGTSLSNGDRETFISNIQNLGGYVLIRKLSEIRFSTSFIRSSDQKNEEEMNTPECKKLKTTHDHLETFRSELKKLCVNFNSINQYKFKIGFKEFQTCEEGALERKLPKPFSDDDLNYFLDKFKIIFNYPDQLDEILGNEIKEKHQSLDCTAFKSIYETDLHRWLAERMNKTYTPEKAKLVFDNIETDILSLELNGFNESYLANVPMEYQFNNIERIKEFLQNDSENRLDLQFEYFGLGPTRVVQTIQNLHKNDSIEEIRKYTRRYGFIFLTMKQLDNKKIFKKISNVCEGKKMWNLLIIECEKDEVTKINEIYKDYRDYFIKMIFMTHTNGEKISCGFTDLTVKSQKNLYKNGKLKIDTEENEFNFSEAIDEIDQRKLIDAETLHTLIVGESVKIENKIRDTDQQLDQYYIERYVARLDEKYSEDDFVKNAEPIVIVSDMAGGGKSSLLSSLCRKLVQYKERVWLFRIDLNDHTKFLDDLKATNYTPEINAPDEMVQFLSDMLQSTMKSTFERNLFKHCLLKPSTLKLAFFFDGFDEISPDYKEIVLELLAQLQKSQDLRVLVTTRPSMVDCLEKKLNLNAFNILPLSPGTDQIEFLKQLYINIFKNSQLSFDIERLKLFANALIEKQCHDIDDSEKIFTSNPLQLRMMADIFFEKCQSFLESKRDDVKECFPDKLDILDLYEKYVEHKLNIYCTEKGKQELTLLAIRDDQKELRNLIETKHQYLALCEFFNSDELSKFLSPEEIEKAKSFIEEVRNGKERRGLVDRVVNDKPYFVHRTFAEYFVASFLAYSLINGKKIEFFECFIRYIREFDTLSAECMKNWLEESPIPEESLRKLKRVIFECSKGADIIQAVLQSECNNLIEFMCNVTNFDCWPSLSDYDAYGKQLKNAAQNIDVLNVFVENGFDIDKLNFHIFLQLRIKSDGTADGGDRIDLILEHSNFRDNYEFSKLVEIPRNKVIFELNKKKFNFRHWLLQQIHSKNVNYDSANCIPLLHASSVDMDSLTLNYLSEQEGCIDELYSVSFGKLETSKGLLSSTIAAFTSDFDFHIRNRQGQTVMHWTATNFRLDQEHLWDTKDYIIGYQVEVNVVEAAVGFYRIDLLEWMLKPKENGGAGAIVDKFREYIRDNIIVVLQNKEFEFCQWLIVEKHLNVNSDKWEDMPLLHASFLHCDLEVSIFLVKNGADLYPINNNGHNALEFAASIKKLEIREWLIEYSPTFSQSGVNIPDNFETFRSKLKRFCDEYNKFVDFHSIDQYKFKIGFKEFQTYDEGALKRKLPKPFSDKFKIIFFYPNRMDQILGNEIKEEHKSLVCEAFKFICDSYLNRWLAERMTTFYIRENAKPLFDGFEDEIFSTQLNGLNGSYFANPIEYQFKPVDQINKFLHGPEECIFLHFDCLELGRMRIVQTLQHLRELDSSEIPNYIRFCGFLFICPNEGDYETFLKIERICKCEGKWNLLVIECKRGETAEDVDKLFKFNKYFPKVIFITDKNGVKIRSRFTDLTDESQAKLYKNGKLKIDTEENEFNFSDAIDIMCLEELIDAETLHKLIEGKSVKIENKIRDTDPIARQYYVKPDIEGRLLPWKPMDHKCHEYDLVHIKKSSVVIVSGMIGSGKSSLLSSLSRKLLQNKKRVWLFRIDLNDHTMFLDLKATNKYSINTPDEMEQFLSGILQSTMKSTFERNLFKHCLLKPSTLKLAFFFDGFDEISPEYRKVVLELLVQLQKSRDDFRIFVTTRPGLVEFFKERLKVEICKMSPILKRKEQVALLTLFWMKKYVNQEFGLNVEKTKLLTRFANALIEKQYHDSNTMEKIFTNPLYLRMMADVFGEKCQSFLNSKCNDVKECFPDKLNIFDLYEKYIELELEFYCTDQKELRSLIETKHQYLALCEIFNSDQLTKLLSPEEIETANSFIVEVRNGKERRGLVDRVVNNKPYFVHRSFAEYLVASFLVNSLINEKNAKIEFFECFIQYIGKEDILSAVDMKIWLEKKENTIPEPSLRKLKRAIFECSKGADFLQAVLQSECNSLIKFICNCFPNGDSNDLNLFFNPVGNLNLKYAQNFEVLNLLVKNGYDIDKLGFTINLQLILKSDANKFSYWWSNLILEHDFREIKNMWYCYREEVIFELNKKKFNFVQWLLQQIHSKNFHYDSKSSNRIPLLHASSIDEDSTLNYCVEGAKATPYSVSFGKLESYKGLLNSTIADFAPDFDFHVRTRQGQTVMHWTATNCRGDEPYSGMEPGIFNGVGERGGRSAPLSSFRNENDLSTEEWHPFGLIIKENVVEAAAACNRIDLLEWMLKPKENGGAGADVDKFREYIRDNIIVALQNKEFEFCQWLIDEKHLNVNSDKWEDMPLLQSSILHCNLEASKFLVKNGADLTAKNKDGHNAPEFAASVDKSEIREWLQTFLDDRFGVDIHMEA